MIGSFLAAIAFLTRLPVPSFVHENSAYLERSARWFPVAGLVIGSISAAAAWFMRRYLPAAVVAVAVLGLDAALTGALHLDGLADMADGFGGGRTRDDVLRIMRDHSIGSYGATALILLLLLKAACLTSLIGLTQGLWALSVAPTLSRWSILLLSRSAVYARTGTADGRGTGALCASISRFDLVFGTVLCAFVLFFFRSKANAGMLVSGGDYHAVDVLDLPQTYRRHHRRHARSKRCYIGGCGVSCCSPDFLPMTDSNVITDFWLIRHGEPERNYHGRCYGSLDISLSPRGRAQMEVAAQRIPPRTLCAIYYSPRARCLQAAEILARHQSCPLTTVDDLAELDFGDFEGKSYNEIAAEHPEIYRKWMQDPTGVCFPGGETFDEMRRRVLNAACNLQRSHAGAAFATVAHGGVNRVILAEALGMAPRHMFRIGQGYASVNLIRYYGEHAVVELVNALP